MVENKKVQSLGEKMLNYIALHEKGVKVSDMEEPFGVTRMKIGYVIKKLLDEGRVKKVKDQYFLINDCKMSN
jgi:predicted transcriptional regulator